MKMLKFVNWDGRDVYFDPSRVEWIWCAEYDDGLGIVVYMRGGQSFGLPNENHETERQILAAIEALTTDEGKILS